MTIEKELFRTKSGWRIMFITSYNTGYIDNVLSTSFSRYIQVWDERKTGSGYSDNPIQYDDGRIAYDYPGRIPQFVKVLVWKAFNRVGKFIYPSKL